MSDSAGTVTNKVTVQSIINLASGVVGGGGLSASGLYWSDNPVSAISDLAYWGSASEASTLTLSGSTVTAWRDRAGGSVALTSTVGTPVLESSAINSRPAVLFDGTAAIYGNVFAGLAKTAPFTLFCVLRPTATTFSGMDASRVCCFGGTATSDFQGLIQLSEYDSNNSTRPYFFGGNSTAVFAADYIPYLRGSALALATKFMVYAFDGTNAVLYENGVVKGTQTAVHGSLSCNASSTAVLSLGGQRGPSNATVLFGKCHIAEVGVYRKALTQVEVNALNGYFASLYATA